MPIRKDLRKSQFKAALALARITQREWATALDRTPEHVSMVLNGRRESQWMLDQIDAFIGKHLHGDAALSRKASAA